jgi:hypothetical protein
MLVSGHPYAPLPPSLFSYCQRKITGILSIGGWVRLDSRRKFSSDFPTVYRILEGKMLPAVTFETTKCFFFCISCGKIEVGGRSNFEDLRRGGGGVIAQQLSCA